MPGKRQKADVALAASGEAIVTYGGPNMVENAVLGDLDIHLDVTKLLGYRHCHAQQLYCTRKDGWLPIQEVSNRLHGQGETVLVVQSGDGRSVIGAYLEEKWSTSRVTVRARNPRTHTSHAPVHLDCLAVLLALLLAVARSVGWAHMNNAWITTQLVHLATVA
jgi:hypothetical protein